MFSAMFGDGCGLTYAEFRSPTFRFFKCEALTTSTAHRAGIVTLGLPITIRIGSQRAVNYLSCESVIVFNYFFANF